MIGGNLPRKQKARALLTQIVNNLTAKMEIGAPMASMYLLGNPDHYTNSKFTVFYWKSYVTHILNIWRTETSSKEKVILMKNKEGEYIAFSGIDDYKYRPTLFSDKSLYEWIQISHRLKRTAAQKKDFLLERYSDSSDDESESESSHQGKCYAFLPGHPLYETHYVTVDETTEVVPNFAGGSLPRCDHGDREYYCTTMLTLFKPWRTGKDLKKEDCSWDETFSHYKFTDHQLKLMKLFNIRYECYDARDDYSKLLKKGKQAGGVFPQWFSHDMMDDMDNISNYDQDENCETFDNEDPSNFIKYIQPGKKGTTKSLQMQEIQEKLKASGWLDHSPNGLPQVNTTAIKPDIDMNSSGWKAAVLS
jgi:hypothetical protein